MDLVTPIWFASSRRKKRNAARDAMQARMRKAAEKVEEDWPDEDIRKGRTDAEEEALMIRASGFEKMIDSRIRSMWFRELKVTTHRHLERPRPTGAGLYPSR